MPTFSLLYSIPYIIIFLLVYLNIIPIYKVNTISGVNYRYNAWFQHFFVFSLLLIFIGFRGFVLTDWQEYYIWFSDAPSLFEGISSAEKFLAPLYVEKGILLIILLCKTISSNYFFFQFFMLAIDIAILYYFFKRVIPNYIIMGFIFFILFRGIDIEFNLLRNAKGIMIFLISIKYIENKKFLYYLLLNCLGAMFHITSLLYIPLYFILNKKIPVPIIILLFVIGNFIFLLRIKWFKVILSSTSFGGRLGFLIERYLASEMYSSAFGISISYIERLLTFVLVLYFSKKLYKINKNNLIYINTLYIYYFSYVYFSEMYAIFSRVSTLIAFSYWIVYPQIYSILKKETKLVFLLLLLLYGVLRMGIAHRPIYHLYDNVLLPYKSYHERVIIINEHKSAIYE